MLLFIFLFLRLDGVEIPCNSELSIFILFFIFLMLALLSANCLLYTQIHVSWECCLSADQTFQIYLHEEFSNRSFYGTPEFSD